MATVYVLAIGLDYEGEDVASVHATLAGAQAAATEAGGEWAHTEPIDGVNHETWYATATGPTPDYYLIHALEVQP